MGAYDEYERNYIIPRNNRELQLVEQTGEKTKDYIIPRNNRELQPGKG